MFSAIGKAVTGKQVTTYLIVNNQTSQSVRVDVPGGDDFDWYEPHQPNKNFRNIKISPGKSVTKQEDINASASGNMVTMFIEFESGERKSVRFDQGKASSDNGYFTAIDLGVRAVGAGVGAVAGAAIGGPVVGGAGGVLGQAAAHEMVDQLRYKPDERLAVQSSKVRIECSVIRNNTMEVLLKEL